MTPFGDISTFWEISNKLVRQFSESIEIIFSSYSSILSPWASSVFSKEGKERKFIISMLLLSSLILPLVLITNSLFIAIAISFSSLFFLNARTPTLMSYFYRFIPSKIKATVGSIQSMIFAIAGIIAMPIVGLCVDLIGARYSIALTSIFIIPAVIIYLMIKEEAIK